MGLAVSLFNQEVDESSRGTITKLASNEKKVVLILSSIFLILTMGIRMFVSRNRYYIYGKVGKRSAIFNE